MRKTIRLILGTRLPPLMTDPQVVEATPLKKPKVREEESRNPRDGFFIFEIYKIWEGEKKGGEKRKIPKKVFLNVSALSTVMFCPGGPIQPSPL